MPVDYPFKLVITCALKQELPLEWIKELGYPIVTLQGLQSGILESLETTKSILFVVTGVGANASKKSALLIRDLIKPTYVVNLGTCGNPNQNYSLGDLVVPKCVKATGLPELPLDSRFPFPLNAIDSLKNEGTLFSSLNRAPSESTYNCVDMEAYFQAQVFHNSDIYFHSVKSVSDYADSDTERIFAKGLSLCRTNMKHLLYWLDRFDRDPSICVVIPAYNREATIARCIESVLAQTYKPKDIIVVDDGSTDSTLSILNSFSDWISVVPVLENKGVSFARNLGVQHSQAEWISFLDSDDEWTPNKLEKQVSFLKQYPFYDILQSEEDWIRDGELFNKKKHHSKQEGFIFDLCLERCMITPSSVLISRTLFNRFIGFDDKLPTCEDYDMWLRISRHHPIGLEHTVSLKKYGGHADQLSEKYPAMDQFRVKSMLKVLEKEKEEAFRALIKAVLTQKIEILVNGHKKRNNWEQVQYFENILARVH